MITWGISANSHDAAIAVFKNDRLVFASQSERFTAIKNDPNLSQSLISYAIRRYGSPQHVFWYEKPFYKTIRQWQAGQGWLWQENNIKKYLKKYNINVDITYVSHHLSHAASAYYTTPWDECAVLVIDSIGEWDTVSIWQGKNNKLKKIYSEKYPHSLGLFYSAMTQRAGLKPQEDEYILMGMAAYGNPDKLKNRILNDFWDGDRLKVNLHRGCKDWLPKSWSQQDYFDLAAATQSIYEDQFEKLLIKAKELTGCDKIALAGGCVLNCSANPIAWKYFKDVWIFPNPGDSGSAVGAVLANTKKKIEWNDCFWGYEIFGDYPVNAVLRDLLKNIPVGVANGKAEFGPRSLGNRSLLADPRSKDMKAKVNQIKLRQQFRPFAPAILEEFAPLYFDMPMPHSRFMQYAVKCKDPEILPAVVHVDGTARIQTVPKNKSGFRILLEEWYSKTGCPVLLNTSLNVKGFPIANDRRDAKTFNMFYNVPVHMHQKITL